MSTVAPDERKVALPAAVASVAFAFVQWPLLEIYSRVHWGVLYNYAKREQLAAVFRPPLHEVLGILDFCRVSFAIGGLLFAAWAICARPRWVGVIAIIAASIGAVIGIGLQM